MVGFDTPWIPIDGKRLRASSWDTTGGNVDWITFKPQERITLLHRQNSPGYIMRIWFTLNSPDSKYLENVKIRCAFDGDTTVADIPIGVFTGTGPWRVNDLRSSVNNIMRSRHRNRDDQKSVGRGSFNIGWKMPYNNEVMVEIFNDSRQPLTQFYYYIDYLETELIEAPLLFHADYHYQELTSPSVVVNRLLPKVGGKNELDMELKNQSNKWNYVFADVKNHQGTYVGTVLVVESLPNRQGKWYEGDDMFFIDGEEWPPSLHGTGTEDYFGMAWGIHKEYQAFDHGVTHYQRNLTDHDLFYDGRFVLYRWHVLDPIGFNESLHGSIEAGHANECEQHYRSVAFWYGKKNE